MREDCLNFRAKPNNHKGNGNVTKNQTGVFVVLYMKIKKIGRTGWAFPHKCENNTCIKAIWQVKKQF